MEYTPGDICDRLERAFRLRFSRNLHAAGREDYYDFRLAMDTGDGAFSLTIVFKACERYCCFESGCHFGLWTQQDWRRLREVFPAVGLEDMRPIHLVKILVIVEKGATFGLGVEGADLQRAEGYSYVIGPYDESHPVDLE